MPNPTRSIDPVLQEQPAWREIMKFYRFLRVRMAVMQLPWIGPALQKKHIIEGRDANWFIPAAPVQKERVSLSVGEAVPAGQQKILPAAVVERLLREADGIFAMKACPCRTAFQCKEHSWDIGCFHLGPATRGISENLGRSLSLDEGLDYLHRAVEDGLIPTILYIPAEAEIFGVDKTRMLSLCFCCECCCDVRLMLRTGPDRYWDLYNNRMPGVRMVVGAECTGCERCAGACYGGERVITFEHGRAVIGERCIGCGRCVQACPSGALHLEIDPDVDWMEALLQRIRAKTTIGA